MDFVSDAFRTNRAQTPFFVTQADFTEVFCDTTDELKASIEGFLKGPTQTQTPVKDGPLALSLLEQIKRDSLKYCSEVEANEALRKVAETISILNPPEQLAKLFKFELHTENTSSVPNAESIGRWLEKQSDERKLFADVERNMRTVKVRRPMKPIHPMDLLLGNRADFRDTEYKVVEEVSSIIVGFKSTVDMPYRFLSLNAKRNFPNLDLVECIVVPLLSRTHIRLFWGNQVYEYVAWDNQRSIGAIEYVTAECPIKDEAERQEILSRITSRFIEEIENTIHKKWPAIESAQVDTANETR